MKRVCGAAVFVLLAAFMALTYAYAEKHYAEQRRYMLEHDIKARGVEDRAVLAALLAVPRHLFVGASHREKAYGDHPLPIGEGQTISQPYVVALMSELLELDPDDRVLEIGTGSGYQAAVLSRLVREVYTIEIRPVLTGRAEKTLKSLGYENVTVKSGDGYFGWKEHAPYDAIMITAFANHIPSPLIQQLKPGGRLILPLGNTTYYQTLTMATKQPDGHVTLKMHGGVSFVPMVGRVRGD